MLSKKFDAEFNSKNISTVKTTLSKVLITAALACFVLALASCNCGGCEQTTITKGAELVLDDTNSIKFYRSIGLSIRAITAIQNNNNKCRDKVLRVCTIDELSIERLTVQCNKDLKLRTETILAGKNLMDLVTKDKSPNNPYWNGNLSLRLPLSDSFASGKYTFVLDGTTKEGKPLVDTAIITY